jgi:hypothetical protein
VYGKIKNTSSSITVCMENNKQIELYSRWAWKITNKWRCISLEVWTITDKWSCIPLGVWKITNK